VGGIRSLVLCALAALVIAAWSSASPRAQAQAQAPQTFRLIVHPKNPAASVDRGFVAQCFLKKVTNWPHGVVIRPVDLVVDSQVRRTFSEEALGRSIAAVKSYWQQIIFSGRGVPPPELNSEDDVVRYVLREPGGIGYVSPNVDIRGARVLPVQ
jgi:ABC-type phosphate transport system substrate-binding protein